MVTTTIPSPLFHLDAEGLPRFAGLPDAGVAELCERFAVASQAAAEFWHRVGDCAARLHEADPSEFPAWESNEAEICEERVAQFRSHAERLRARALRSSNGSGRSS